MKKRTNDRNEHNHVDYGLTTPVVIRHKHENGSETHEHLTVRLRGHDNYPATLAFIASEEEE